MKFDETLVQSSGEILRRALSMIPDGASVATAKAETRTSSFSNVSILVDGNDTLTDVLYSGYQQQDRQGVRTEISFTTLSCLCADVACNSAYAADLSGIWYVDDSGPVFFYGSRSPLFLLHPKTGERLPCLSIFQALEQELEVTQCSVDTDFQVTGFDLFPFRKGAIGLKECADNNLTLARLRLRSTQNAVARPPDGSELKFDIADAMPYQNPWLDGQTIPIGRNFLLQADFGIFDFVSQGRLVDMFGAKVTNGSILFSDLADDVWGEYYNHPGFVIFHRILLGYTCDRLIRSTRVPDPVGSADLLTVSPVYQAILDDIPGIASSEALTRTVIVINMVLLCGTGALFAWTCGLYLASVQKCRDCVNLTKMASVLGSAFTFASTVAAYALLWREEYNQSNFEESMAVVDVQRMSRSHGFFPLHSGHDLDPFMATVYSVRVSDATQNYLGLFLFGSVATLVFLVVFLMVGYRSQPRESPRTLPTHK